MIKRRFAIRTIRDGRVKINGVWFAPSEQWQPYDGRLNGMRYAFGLYYRETWDPRFVCLWGSEENYHSDSAEFEYGPELADGGFPWYWWNAVRG